eukprot:1665469-Pleurochrysis_carterae.AAC.3
MRRLDRNNVMCRNPEPGCNQIVRAELQPTMPLSPVKISLPIFAHVSSGLPLCTDAPERICTDAPERI